MGVCTSKSNFSIIREIPEIMVFSTHVLDRIIHYIGMPIVHEVEEFKKFTIRYKEELVNLTSVN